MSADDLQPSLDELEPQAVAAALERMKAGDVDAAVFAVIVAAAEAFATLQREWVFASPQAGMVYATQNVLLAETLVAARPGAMVVERLAPPLLDPQSTDQETGR